MTDGPVLKITAADYTRLRATLLTPCGREHKLYAELGRTGRGFTVHRLLIPADDDYLVRSPTFVELTPQWMMRTLRAFAETGAEGVLEAHSHPFASRAGFSGTDDVYITEVREDFQRKRPGCAFLRLVVGRLEDGFTLQVFDTHLGTFLPLDEIVVVGDGGTRRIRSHVAPKVVASKGPDAAYQRVAAVRTPDEHARISGASAVVVGAGGAGWLVAQLLCALGVGHITLIDPDGIETANLNRLVGVTQADVANGRPKVERLATILRDQDPTREVIAIAERFPSNNTVTAVERADFVVCAVDDPPTRLAVQRLCARHLVPALDVGSAVYMDDARAKEDERHGHAWLYVPGQACWLHMGLQQQGIESETLREARRAAGYVVDDSRESPGSVQTLNAAVVSFGLTLLEAYLMGRRPVHNVVLYEERVTPSLVFKLRQYGVGHRADCPLCGLHGVVGLGGNPFLALDSAPLDVPAPPALFCLVAQAATQVEPTVGESNVKPAGVWSQPSCPP